MYGQKAPMTPSAFKELAKPMVSKQDWELLNRVSLDPRPSSLGFSYAEKIPSSGSSFIDKWCEWERALRLNLAKQRATKIKNHGVLTEPPVLPTDAAMVAHKAIAEESPLEAEILLDKARWEAIDDLQGLTYFSSNTIFAYMLKLLILQRRALFETETGFSEYKSLYASILGNAQQGTSGGRV
jgi:hypothetical protein